ncbi:hypothetical protein, partial [Vibrio parahaemolyticus]|uniref:hypothetical protein n=1 Tax=Vibrio parahaemolyticus TaxID=670 RepID=UPI0021147605
FFFFFVVCVFVFYLCFWFLVFHSLSTPPKLGGLVKNPGHIFLGLFCCVVGVLSYVFNLFEFALFFSIFLVLSKSL